MKNILTFDIEEWYDANYPELDSSVIDYKKSNLEAEVEEILDNTTHTVGWGDEEYSPDDDDDPLS